MSTETKHVEKLICKYRDCTAAATVGQFCGASHKAGYYRDQRATNTEGSAIKGQSATSCATNQQPADSGKVHILRRADLGRWRGTRPLYLDKPTGFEHLSDYALVSRLTGLNPWQGSPEYAERVYRLVHGLTDYMLPANMAVEVAR